MIIGFILLSFSIISIALIEWLCALYTMPWTFIVMVIAIPIFYGALNFRGVEVVENDKNHGV